MTPAQQRKFLRDLIRCDIDKIQDVNTLDFIWRVVEQLREAEKKHLE